jgi:predicted transcriptional regulator of viral defense system
VSPFSYCFIAGSGHIWYIIAMKWTQFLDLAGNEPVFSSSLLKTAGISAAEAGKQLSRWVKSGKLIQIRRGLYMLAEPYRKIRPHPFYIANKIQRGSYVSLQSALEYYGLTPEYVPAVTSVTTRRTQTFTTPLGNYIFRHVKKELFFDYVQLDMGGGQLAFVATPEKSLLDLLYLTPGSDNPSYLRELRLQNLENLDIERLKALASQSRSHKLIRATEILENLVREF